MPEIKTATTLRVKQTREEHEAERAWKMFLECASDRIPIPGANRLCDWFLLLPQVQTATCKYSTRDFIEITLHDGTKTKFESGIRPAMLLDALRYLVELLDVQLQAEPVASSKGVAPEISWYHKDGVSLYVTKGKRKRPPKRKRTKTKKQ